MSQRFGLPLLPLAVQLQANSLKEILKLAEMIHAHVDQAKNINSVMGKAETLLLLAL
jgi:hypothetical protein